LQQTRRTTKQIDGIAARKIVQNKRHEGRSNAASLLRHRQYNAAADAQQQGFGNIIKAQVWREPASGKMGGNEKHRKI
jgi:hypothetical protein